MYRATENFNPEPQRTQGKIKNKIPEPISKIQNRKATAD
jgi:hypothetical protein